MRFKVPFVALNQTIRYSKEITDAFIDCANSGQYVLGKKLKYLKLSLQVFVQNIVYIIEMVDALLISLKLLKVNKGDEVIITVNSFVASAGSIVASGAKPVFVILIIPLTLIAIKLKIVLLKIQK